MDIYISIIQVCLFILTALVVFCELTVLFADTVKSVIVRLTIGTGLVVAGYYTNELGNAPYFLTFILLGIVLIFTVFTFKYIIEQYQERSIRLSRIDRKINKRQKRCLF